MKKNIAKLLSPIVISVIAVFAFAAQTFSEDLPDARGLFGNQTTADQAAETASAVSATNCRYGVGYIPNYSNSLAWVPTLDAGWYLNFGVGAASNVDSAEFVPVISIKQDKLNGQRLETYTVLPPLASYYLDEQNGKIRPGLGTLISRNPGSLWLVGNEVDVHNDQQGNTMPQVYARAYHEIYHYIKKADPTAKVAHASLSMMTTGRMQYLDIVWDTYQQLYGQAMPVDVWNMHLYILSERHPLNQTGYGDGKIALGTDPNLAKWDAVGDPAKCPNPNTPDNDPRLDVYCRSEHDSVRIFKEQLLNMRQWMKAHGQQDKPLIISEYGLLYPYVQDTPTSCFLADEFGNCFAPQRVSNYLRGTMDVLDTWTDQSLGYPQDGFRMVQQWLWYSIVTNPEWSGGSSNLIVQNFESFTPGDPAALTVIGQAFRDEALSSQGGVNLAGGQANNVVGYLKPASNTGSARITASFRNSGITSITQPFKVTFYRNAALTQPIGSVTFDPNVGGAVTGCTWGGRNNFQVSMIWNNLPVGSHNYWAVVDSENVISETVNNDNVTSQGTVNIFRYANFSPVVGTLANN
jgi:hypothetical protein